jgi:iron complex outermembrane receptor protein
VALDLGTATLKSITAYRNLDGFSTSDPDGTVFRIYDQQSPTRQNQFSQELQLTGSTADDRFDYVLGGYYFPRTGAADPVPVLPAAHLPAAGAGGHVQHLEPGQRPAHQQLRGIRPGTLPLLRPVRGAAGAGATRGRTSPSSPTRRSTCGPTGFRRSPRRVRAADPPGTRTIIPIANNVPGRLEFERFTPKVGLEFKPSDDVLVFATFSRGFRSGGFNGRLIVPTTTVPTYAPDTADSYELGIKSDLLDNTLRLNVTGFYTRY